ncbi:hypothetical protein [Yokenella regensburgei]|uniref:hypothetical protein n=1 Tax=Yokenella regensburgei TaxID=158877 RepID=UPI003EDB520C
MILKLLPAASLVLLAACASTGAPQGVNKTATKATPAEKYVSHSTPLTPENTIASSSNRCVDNFNFLRQAGSGQYQKYSQDYIKIGDGYRFLNTNKNIMGDDAKAVYTMKLDMKLDTLCNRVDYAGYQVIKEKIKALYGI